MKIVGECGELREDMWQWKQSPSIWWMKRISTLERDHPSKIPRDQNTLNDRQIYQLSGAHTEGTGQRHEPRQTEMVQVRGRIPTSHQ